MGKPTESDENLPEQGGSASSEAAQTPAAPSAPDTPSAPDVPDSPYQPAVRAYENRRPPGASSPASASSAPPTEAIPSVTGAAGAAGAAGADDPAQSSSGTAGTPLEGLQGDGAPSRWPKVLLGVGAGVVVLAGLYVGAQWFVADSVPSGTTVAGVDLGGLDATEAVTALEQGLAPRAAEPVTVQAGEVSSTVDPTEAGLSLDAQATVDGLTGFSLSPGRLIDHLAGGGEVAPEVDVDRAALTATVSSVADSLATEPVDGTVQFADGEPVATEAADGTEVVTDAAEEVLVGAWLVSTGPVDLPTEAVPPQIDQADTDAALEVAEEIVSGPVTVEVDDQSPELPPRVLARSTSFVPADGALVAEFDGDRLTSALIDRTDDLLSEPNDARFEFSGGEPAIVGGEIGTTLDPEAVASAVGEAAQGGERRTTVELVEEDPEDSVASLEELGVKEVVSEFSTPLTSEPVRTKNLVRGAELVNETLVKPGETFSLLDTLSPIDTSNGFFAAGVVSNGLHVDAVGGGLSQMATTTYNAGFFAGFDDVEHRQHSYWFSRYPAGREATIYVGSIDMKFKNDTPYGALMQSYVADGRLHVKIWSTEYYDVEESDSGKQEVVPIKTVDKSGSPGCEPYSGGQAGFAITVYRKVYLDGELVKDESNFWRYKPDDAVSCSRPATDEEDD
ncbi:VanW family protein [Isoptericola halotolerans]|uniref:Vancomycin resistance protein YoaR n=1 Tax=Isoptericola halotolerans TaxID=300560 RepID=A0ABX2A1F5_9MICO|nr:VanW family protein [Isoptericola halotolerans]NOV96504.1 vancomycin resistance protein YoaR [Isoptericola halotolerans]